MKPEFVMSMYANKESLYKAKAEYYESEFNKLTQELQALREQKPYEIEWPEYHNQGMGCGLEDRNITDRYDAMRYGWDEAIQHIAQILPENLYAAPMPAREGCKLVPIEPTAEMLKAAQRAEMDHSDHDDWLYDDIGTCQIRHKAMLEAAPKESS